MNYFENIVIIGVGRTDTHINSKKTLNIGKNRKDCRVKHEVNK